MNGHLPGASIVLMQTKYRDSSNKYYENINLLFTGDYNNKNLFFDVKPVPKFVYQLPISIIQEATYGDMDSTDIEYVFEKNLLNAVVGLIILFVVYSGFSMMIKKEIDKKADEATKSIQDTNQQISSIEQDSSNIKQQKDIYTDFLKTSVLPQSYNTSV